MGLTDAFERLRGGVAHTIDRAHRMAWPLAVLAFALGCAGMQFQAEHPADHQVMAMLICAALVFTLGFLRVLRWQRGVRSRYVGANILLWLISAGALGFGWAAYTGAQRVSDAWPPDLEGKNVTVLGYVATMPTVVSGGQRVQFVIESSDSNAGMSADSSADSSADLKGKKIALSWYGEHPLLQPAQRYRIVMRAKQRHGGLNPHGFDYELWLVQRGMAATAYLREPPQDTGTQVLAFLPWVERYRAAARSALYAAASDERAGRWAAALALGDQRSLNDADWQRYNGTGTGHLLAVSGSHIMMMGALLAWLAGRWWSAKPARLLKLARHELQQHVMLLSSAAYALMAGWELPAQRTVLMLAVAWLAYRFSARSAVWHVMACAGGLALALDPLAVISPSFWLSYGAVALLLSLSTGAPNTQRDGLAAMEAPTPTTFVAKPTASQTRWAALRLAAKTQWFLTVALLPLGAVFFSQISLVSPLANALAIPVMGWVSTPLALLAGALAWLWPALATALMQALLAVQQGLDTVLDALLKVPFAQTTVPQMPVPFALLCLVAAGACIALRARARQAAAGVVAICIGVAAFAPQWLRSAPQGWQVVFLDVGQGMAVAVHSQGRTLLFDAGPRYGLDSDGAARIIVPYLSAIGVRQLDHVILSHADDDHTGGVRSLLARLPVAQWWASLPSQHPLRSALPTHTLPCVAGQQLLWAGLRLEWLHPPADVRYDGVKANVVSCVVRISDGVRSALLTGDIEAAQETALVARYGAGLKSEVLLAPHHGSKTSSTQAFLEAVAPQHVVIQNGYRNRFGHPHPSVVARYQAQGLTQWRSDADGAVIASFDDAGLSVQAWRQVAKRYWHTHMPAVRGQADGLEF